MKKSVFKHWVEKDVILSLNSANLLSVRSLDIKRAVSSVSDRIYMSWVLRSGRKALVFLKLFYERVWTALRLPWKTKSLELAANSRIWWSGPLLRVGLLWPFSAVCLCLYLLIWNPLIGSSLLEKRPDLHLDVWNAGCLSGMVVIEKIVSFHELGFIKLIVSEWKSAQVYCFEDWRLEDFTFGSFKMSINLAFSLEFKIWLNSIFVPSGSAFQFLAHLSIFIVNLISKLWE